MQIGMVGLGRMGGNMVRRLMRGGHSVVVYDRSPDAVSALAAEGAADTASIDEFVGALQPPRVAWVMVPAGDPTDAVIGELAARLGKGDVVIDGGNSHYKDDVRRAALLGARDIAYVDVGTSGGLWGLARGYCLMIGGQPQVVAGLEPIFRTLAPGAATTTDAAAADGGGTAARGYLHCGPAGAGHFVKMVHNGIEYGLMQAYAEGLDILRHAGALEQPPGFEYEFKLEEITEVWRHGSVIESWLLDLTAAALKEQPDLAGFSGVVQDSGEGRWTIEAAIDEAVPVPVLAASLFARFRSRQAPSFADKVLSAMRFKFGGHVEPAREPRS
jgi:6-phosphogluconate dehydrogenase